MSYCALLHAGKPALPKAVLESQTAFYDQVYRLRRDELAARWNQRAGASAKG